LTLVSHRIHDLVLHVLQLRLSNSASLAHEHTLLLECYHPSDKLTEPPLFCTYLGCTSDQSSASADDAGAPLRRINSTYAHFRPHRRPAEPATARPGDIPGSRTHPGTNANTAVPATEEEEEETEDSDPAAARVTQHLHLDSGERFTQLCATTSLVKIGPRAGLFRSCVCVGDGVVRVFRDWLRKRARVSSRDATTVRKEDREEKEEEDDDYGYRGTRANDRAGVLWTSPAANVGISFRVRERGGWRRNVNVTRAATGLSTVGVKDDDSSDDEERPVSYEVTYEELLVRATELLRVTERSIAEEQAWHEQGIGKAIVWGAFV